MSDLRQWQQRDILSLGMEADEVRRRVAGDLVVTYRRVHTVTDADADRAGDVPAAAVELRAYECPPTLEAAVARVQAMAARAGGRRVAAYSMSGLERAAAGGWGPLAAILDALASAGLSDVAELPADEVDDLTASVRALVAAGILPRRVTISRPTGERRLDLIARVRQCREATGFPRFFAPLPHRAPPDTPTTGYDDLRMVALARIGLADLTSAGAPFGIEVDWSQYGPKLAQVALTFGADHLDAVPATSDDQLGPRRSTTADVERNIRAAGYEPREDTATR